MGTRFANCITRNAWQRAWVSAAAIVACTWWLGASGQSCPASDPNQDDNCPIGPIYALPGWGNVPWSLPQYYPSIVAGDLDGDGRDELIGRDARESDPQFDLRTTTLTVRRLLHEPYFGGELVNDLAGNDFVPTTLLPSVRAGGKKATFETSAGSSPHIAVDV
jgi:hypothetical protein